MTVIEWAKSKGYKPELSERIDLEVSIPKSERMIMSFDGLEEFKKLKTFYIRDSNYDFSKINFSKLKDLKDVSFANCVNFKSLSFSNNLHLKELRVIECTGIESLEIEGSSISILHLSGCTKLESLRIEHLPKKVEYVELAGTKLLKYKVDGFLKTLENCFVGNNLNRESDLRGTASIMDTGLFDFKTTKI